MINTPTAYVKTRCRYCARSAYMAFNSERFGRLDLCHSHLELFRMHGGTWTGNRMMRAGAMRAKAEVA